MEVVVIVCGREFETRVMLTDRRLYVTVIVLFVVGGGLRIYRYLVCLLE